MNKTPSDYIQDYRDHVTARGDKPKAVWTVVRTGTIINWFLSKRRAEKEAASQFDCTIKKAT